MRNISLVLLFIIFNLGCSTLHKSAKEFLEEKSYQDAINVYNEILNKDSSDEEALIGLKKAQLGWLGQKLIEVRLLRQSGNHKKSLNLLLEIYNRQNIWSVYPLGAVAFTQKEETHFALTSVVKVVDSATKDKKPLRAQLYLDRYKLFFQSDKAQSKYKKLQSSVKKSGLEYCRGAYSSLKNNEYYYGSFINNLCLTWNQKKPNLKKQVMHIQGKLYGKVELDLDFPDLPKPLAKTIKHKLEESFKNTPWYKKSASNILNIRLKGNYSYKHDKSPETLQHSYQVRVPYKNKYIEDKDSDEDKPDFLKAMDAVVSISRAVASLSGSYEGNSTYKRDNHDGTVTVYETKYYNEPRVTSYSAIKHTEFFKGDVVLKTNLDNDEIDISYNMEDRNISVEHSNNSPDIGLSPKSADLIGESEWFNILTTPLIERFNSHLVAAWDTKFCDSDFDFNSSHQPVESMFRCLKVRKENVPLNILSWFESSHGVSYHEANEVLGEIL